MTSREKTQFLPLADPAQGGGQRRNPGDLAMVALFGAISWPWLLRSLSGGSPLERERLMHRLDLPTEALPNLGSWKADAVFLNLIVDVIEARRPQCVVEFGAGASSLVASRALQRHSGGRLHSFDSNPEFVRSTLAWLSEFGLSPDIRTAPLVASPEWGGLWYDLPLIPDSIDLLIVDGPHWSLHPFVRGAAERLFDRLPVGATILLDDAARPGERIIASRWRRRWPGFNFRYFKLGTKGALIGERWR